MNFWQRGLKSVTRRKGRSLILFLVVFILGNVIAGAVSIEQSTKNVEVETKKQMGARATISMDYERFDEEYNKNPEKFENNEEVLKNPSLKELESIGKLPYVKYFDYSSRAHLGTNKIKAYKPEEEDAEGAGVKHQFNMKGVNRKEMVDVEEGLIKIVEGTTLEEKDVQEGTRNIIISKEVAELNNLSVGDQFVLDVTGENYGEEGMIGSAGNADQSESTVKPEITTFDFPTKIVGIFTVVKKEEVKEKSSEENSNQDWQAMEQINTIYGPNKLVQELSKEMQEKIWKVSAEERVVDEDYETTYVLKSIDDLEAFREEANALLTNDYYHVVASSDQYDQVAGGMQKLGKISGYVVIIAVAASLMIISLIVLLFLRDRKHELGIYLSLGEKRSQIIGQILVELLLTSALALILSLITGNLLAGGISESLLQTDWLSGNQEDMMYYSSMISSDLTPEDVQNTYHVTFSVGYIVSYLLIGLSTVLLSAIVPLLYILRLNPKKIMM
ncbi:ABC transporter permease [Enterococcus alcedinis]|uniref:ABC transporter permease n=1 Tax=Enterococcus alcedinis TaxID=1274384 RepID=A0A917JHC3_9ENTE|nr:ABC transporter permease [Enterococcus alcedinis]MBP2101692.1 putative ABC transport system permease protein [Enterococcus alcedinis]GGI66834.1 ABC transporter permease [Enterococcus alcedinis]